MGREIGGAGDRFQVGLRDLAIAVLGSAFVLDVARRSRAAWGGGPPDMLHALGLGVLALAVALALIVVTRRSRGLRVGEGPASRPARAWALAWRSAAVGWLACSVSEVTWILQIDRPALAAMAVASNSLEVLRADALLALVPVCVALGLIGLILAASPCRARQTGPFPTRRRSGPAWLSCVVAGLAGLAIVALGYMAIPYLVLMALDAVSNATRKAPMVPRPTLLVRLATTGLNVSATALACLATAAWLGEDLRGAGRDPDSAREPRSMAGILARATTAGISSVGGLYLLLVTLPRLHPCLADGFWVIVDPITAATIVLGFAGLAAGIAARASAALTTAGLPTVPETRPRLRAWSRRLLHAAGCLVAAEVLAAAVLSIIDPGDLARPWYIPLGLRDWLDVLRYPANADWFAAAPASIGRYSPFDRPGDLVLLLAAPWIAVNLLPLIAGGPNGPPPALDAIAADPIARRRFLGWWAALTAVMLAALPVFFLGGIALLHEFLRRVAR